VWIGSEVNSEYESQWATILSIAGKIGCTSETLRRWMRQQERLSGQRTGPTIAEQERIKALKREVHEPRKANEILCLASAFFYPGGARPPPQTVKAFIDRHRHAYGVGPICGAADRAAGLLVPRGATAHSSLMRC